MLVPAPPPLQLQQQQQQQQQQQRMAAPPPPMRVVPRPVEHVVVKPVEATTTTTTAKGANVDGGGGAPAKKKKKKQHGGEKSRQLDVEKMENYPCRRMKVKLKEAGQQLIYDDLCALARRQAEKRGFVSNKAGAGLHGSLSSVFGDAMGARPSVFSGGGRLNEVIERLERGIWQTYSDSEEDGPGTSVLKAKKKKKKVDKANIDVTPPRDTHVKKRKAKSKNAENDEYYDIDDPWIDDASLDSYFEPCEEHEEYQGFYVNQGEVTSVLLPEGVTKGRAPSNNLLSKKKSKKAAGGGGAEKRAQDKAFPQPMKKKKKTTVPNTEVVVPDKAPRDENVQVQVEHNISSPMQAGDPIQVQAVPTADPVVIAIDQDGNETSERTGGACAAVTTAPSTATTSQVEFNLQHHRHELLFQNISKLLKAIIEDNRKRDQGGGDGKQKPRASKETMAIFADIRQEMEKIVNADGDDASGARLSQLRGRVLNEIDRMTGDSMNRKAIRRNLVGPQAVSLRDENAEVEQNKSSAALHTSEPIQVQTKPIPTADPVVMAIDHDGNGASARIDDAVAAAPKVLTRALAPSTATTSQMDFNREHHKLLYQNISKLQKSIEDNWERKGGSGGGGDGKRPQKPTASKETIAIFADIRQEMQKIVNADGDDASGARLSQLRSCVLNEIDRMTGDSMNRKAIRRWLKGPKPTSAPSTRDVSPNKDENNTAENISSWGDAEES